METNLLIYKIKWRGMAARMEDIMNKEIKLDKYDTLEVILPDGVRLTIYDDNGDIDIKTMYCGIKVLPRASNHIIIEKDSIKIPQSK